MDIKTDTSSPLTGDVAISLASQALKPVNCVALGEVAMATLGVPTVCNVS